MNATDTKLNEFQSRLEAIKRHKEQIMMEEGQFNQDWVTWLKDQGMPENFTIVDLVMHFRKKIILA